MVDISHITEARPGDEVIIYGDGENNTLSIDEASKLAQTNKNELVCRITRRTPRVYIKDKKVHKLVNYLLED